MKSKKKAAPKKAVKKAKSGTIKVKLTAAHKKVIKQINEDYQKRKASVADDKPIPVPAEMVRLLKQVMYHQNPAEWANVPNPAFGDKKPVEVWKKDKQPIVDMVNRIIHGVIS